MAVEEGLPCSMPDQCSTCYLEWMPVAHVIDWPTFCEHYNNKTEIKAEIDKNRGIHKFDKNDFPTGTPMNADEDAILEVSISLLFIMFPYLFISIKTYAHKQVNNPKRSSD